MFLLYKLSFKGKFIENVSKRSIILFFLHVPCKMQISVTMPIIAKRCLRAAFRNTLNTAEILNAYRFHRKQSPKTLEPANSTFYNEFSGLRLQMPPDRASMAVVLEVILLFLRICYME